MQMRKVLIGGVSGLAVVGLALVLSACGSSDETTTTALSKAAFLKQGNEICEKGNEKIGEEAEETFSQNRKPSQKELNEFASDTLIPSVQKQIDEIRALGAPEGDEEEVEAIVTAAQAALDKGKQNLSELTEDGPGPFAEANKLANAYGLTACGEEEGGGEKGEG
jgi:hypothetical protein